MSTSALLSALRAAGRKHITASTLGARPQATGSHLFRIHRFKQVREKTPNGTELCSGLFSVGGHDWRIQCYPNGNLEQTQGSISLFLKQTSHARTGGATAAYKLSILDKFGNPSRTEFISKGHLFTDQGWGWKDFMKLEDLDNEKHLQDDCLSVLCDITVDIGLRTEDYTGDELTAPDKAMAPPPWINVHGLAEVLWKTQQADVKIQTRDGHTFTAHRWVLESRSSVFKADLALAAELRMDHMDADVCKALLQFMYTDSLPQEQELAKAMAERLLVAADRYELEKLKLVCEEALGKNIDTSSVTPILALAERHRCPALREACMQFLSNRSMREIVLASPDGFEKLKTASPSAVVELGSSTRSDRHITS